MSETLLVAFRVIDQSNGPRLDCNEMAEGDWPSEGRTFDNWQQLKGTMRQILGKPEAHYEALKRSPIDNEAVTREQLYNLRLPGYSGLNPAASQTTLLPEEY